MDLLHVVLFVSNFISCSIPVAIIQRNVLLVVTEENMAHDSLLVGLSCSFRVAHTHKHASFEDIQIHAVN